VWDWSFPVNALKQWLEEATNEGNLGFVLQHKVADVNVKGKTLLARPIRVLKICSKSTVPFFFKHFSRPGVLGQ